MKRPRGGAVALVLAAGALLAAPLSAQTTVLRADRLLDGRGGPPLSPGMVAVEENRIVAVGADLPSTGRGWEEELVMERVLFVMKDGRVYRNGRP